MKRIVWVILAVGNMITLFANSLNDKTSATVVLATALLALLITKDEWS